MVVVNYGDLPSATVCIKNKGCGVRLSIIGSEMLASSSSMVISITF